MQKWKVCKKLMAVILTLCMVLPLISNQYLVVRAEELSQISSLKSSCREIDMTQQKKVTLEEQQYSDTQYQYAISGWYESTPRHGTDNGVLYKIKLAAGQAVQIKKNDNYIYGNGCYWYGEETIDQYTDSGMATYQNNGSESVSVYCWVVKDQDSNSTFSLTIESGQKVTDLSDKAFDIKETLELKKSAGNYVENLISGSSMLNGWLYKTSNEEKVYSINNLDKTQIISVDLFDEFGSEQQSVHLMAEDYTDGYDTTGDETSNQLTISENISYVFVVDNGGIDNLILKIGEAKKLSEIQNIDSLTEDTTKEYAEDDKVVTLANEKCYLYKFEVPANSMIGLTVEVDGNNYTSDLFFIYGEDGTIEGSKTDTGAIINNVSDTSKTYYVGVKKSVTTYGNKFKLSYESVNQLKDCTPVELNEEQPEFTVSESDERIKTVAKMDQNGSWQIASGILLKVIIPKKSTVSLNNNSFMYYTDLSQSAYPYYDDYNFSKLNDTDEEEAIYIFASVGETWKMTVTHDSDSKVPDLAELSPLSISEGTTTIDQNQAKLTNVKVKNYTDEDGNLITSIMQEGILYKYDIPAHMNATINMGIAELDGSYGWMDVYENLDDYPITSICANYGDTPKTVYIWAVPDSVDGVENPTYEITIKNTSNQYTYTTPYDEEVENLSEIQDVYIYSWNTELGDRLDSFFGSHPEYVDKVHFVNKECDATDSNYYDFVNGELSKNDSVIAAFDRDTITQETI